MISAFCLVPLSRLFRPRGRGVAGCGVAITVLLSSGLLAGCSEETWNNPHLADEFGKNIIYSSFSERPKHLDPARSYSADEGRFIDQIYDAPLQYHYLKRPYELEPNTLTHMPGFNSNKYSL